MPGLTTSRLPRPPESASQEEWHDFWDSEYAYYERTGRAPEDFLYEIQDLELIARSPRVREFWEGWCDENFLPCDAEGRINLRSSQEYGSNGTMGGGGTEGRDQVRS